MKTGTTLLGSLAAAGCVALALEIAPSTQASTNVLAGFDLFTTSSASFGGAPFVGVPLGTYDFGTGPLATGTTDTIVERKADASVPSMPAVAPAIPIEMLALQLVSAVPVDFGSGLGLYYITLQSARGGPATTGTMTIGFASEADPHGTFASIMDVFFDVRFGALAGPIVLTDDLILTSSGTPWSHTPPPGALLIEDVNHDLNGINTDSDFWPAGFTETHPSGAMHQVQPTFSAQTEPVPEGDTAWLAIPLGLAGCWYLRSRRRASR